MAQMAVAACVAVGLVLAWGPCAGAVANPVLKNTADCGTMKFGGAYYLMGAGTNGGLYLSDDLVHWRGPVHAFSMDNEWTSGPEAADSEIHACALEYVNGVFHLYWSVNYKELRQIGHATAEKPLGPYTEPVRDVPFDGRIDPDLFVDDDGRCYFYTTRFSDGNEVWGQAMKDPWTLEGEPVRLLTPMSGGWEWLDHRVNEAQTVVKYRGTYYMLYNANHTAEQYGNYAIGCAVAGDPLGFRNDGKYPRPVLAALPGRSIHNCGQISLVRGPNGFEWWAVYFAIYGMSPRHQAIDRVHFFDRELYIDGPTGEAAPGYHPPPRLPAFRDAFDDAEGTRQHWDYRGGSWKVDGGELLQEEPAGCCAALPRMESGAHYLAEATLRMGTPEGRAGVLAAWRDEENWAAIGLDAATGSWFVERCAAGQHTVKRVDAPAGFRFHASHTLRVERDGPLAKVWVDAWKWPGSEPIDLGLDGPAVPGVFTSGGPASFQMMVATFGWDEWDAGIRGWAAPGQTTLPDGWRIGEDGLAAERPGAAVKGDLLPSYEFAAQCTFGANPAEKAAAGIHAVYVDDKNFLSAHVEPQARRLVLSGKRDGEPLDTRSVPIPPRTPQHPGTAASSFNLRAVKLAGRVLVFVDGAELAEFRGAWPPSRVGLVHSQGACRYNGISLIGIPPTAN